MLARRIIPCLDVRDGKVVKGIRFREHRIVGDIVELAVRYRQDGADELVFYDITASPQKRSVDVSWVRRVAAELDIPFCVAGGITSVDHATRVLEAGADKISVNTPAVRRPDLIDELVAAVGTQCVVIGIDSDTVAGEYSVHANAGDPAQTEIVPRRTLAWVAEVQERGAGEIVLNCMSHDGVRTGYDIEQLSAARNVCSVPLIASGGAGSAEHFAVAFAETGVDGCLAASVFHSGELAIPTLKQYLDRRDVRVRLTTFETDRDRNHHDGRIQA